MQRIALVVDDSRVARMTLKKLLGKYQFDVIELSSGEEAIDYLQTEKTRPDIIFMDVMMGGMDGLSATQQIKKLPLVKDIPVVICTGNNTKEDKSKAINVGAVTALSKPPAADELATIIGQIERVEVVEQAPINTQPPFNEAEVTATILMAIEQKLLAKAHQDIRETIKEISPQIVGKMTEALVEQQINAYMKQSLVDLTKNVSAKIDGMVEKTAQQVCTLIAQESATEAASKAVQKVIDEADITSQVTQFLAEKGEEWLEEQEEDLGSQLSIQLERLIPTICTEYLDTHLAAIVSPLVQERIAASVKESVVEENTRPVRNEVEEMIHLALHQHTNTVVNPIVNSMVTKQLAAQTLLEQDEEAIDTLTLQVLKLKNITIGLGVVVVGLLIAIIV